MELAFSRILLEWMDYVKMEVRPSTYAKYFFLSTRHIMPGLGDVPAQALTAERLNRFLTEEQKGGNRVNNGALSRSSLQSIRYIIKAVMDYAVVLGYIQNSPTKYRSFRLERRKITTLDTQAQMNLKALLLREIDAPKLGIFVCLYTGLRIGEICALRWEDIDRDSRILRVKNTVQRVPNPESNGKVKTMLVIGSPKSISSQREIPLSPVLSDLFNRYFPEEHNGFLLTGSSIRIMEPRTYQYRFKRYLAQSGIRDVNFHALRHTFATECVRVGCDAKTLSEILGHANVNITLDRYVHPSRDMKRKQIELLS
ncbi:MAG: site-specific integrase [Lachnospiraceae bacterium]|jgi:integrase|nr:site-specific integrase [Lachnospiraceae bacterium]